jgi:hypothetical protein
VTGRRIPDRHVVLTFDDGPSRWTEEILDILAARGVKATFFLVGARAADRLDRGAVVMMHDGGGDRSQTVAALDELITQLQRRGYTFDTVSSAINTSPWNPASTSQRVQGWLLSMLVRTADLIVLIFKLTIALLAVLAVLRTLVLVVLARHHVRQPALVGPARRARLPDVSIIVPAYNEQNGIGACVRSLAAADYPNVDIVVVDDGSTDDTAAVVTSLALPNVRLVSQRSAGKPAALNTGILLARHDILILVDGDTIFEPDAVRALVEPFAEPNVGAVSGNTKVGNRRGLLGRWQHIEYVIGLKP